MREVGRRGEITLLYEFVISLILLGLFIWVSYSYIFVVIDGGPFWSKVNAVDLATSAEIANAPDGDVLLRYDNLKPRLRLGYWLSNGRVAVASFPRDKAWYETIVQDLLKGKTEEIRDRTEPGDAAVQTYGNSASYPRPGYLENPTFLALRKVGESFSILPADLADTSCPHTTPPIPIENARVQLSVGGSYTGFLGTSIGSEKKTIRSALESTVRGTPILVVDKDGTIPITITVETGQQAALSLTPQGVAGSALACQFAQTLHLTSLGEFEGEAPKAQGPGFGFAATITIPNDAYLTPEQVGNALGLALVEAYR